MGKSLQGWIGSYSLGTAAIVGTKFCGILGSCNIDSSGVVSIASGETDEAAPGHVTDFAGTIRKPYVSIQTNELPSAMTFIVRVNEVDTDCVVSVAAGQTGHILGTGEATFESGDYIDVVIHMPATDLSSTVLGGIWCEMETEGGHFGVYKSNYDHGLLGDIRTSNAKGGGAAGIDYYASGITATYFIGSNHTGALVTDVTPTTPPPSLTKVHSNHDDIAVPCEQMVRVPGTFTSGRLYLISVVVDPLTTGVRSANFSLRKNGGDVATICTVASNGTPGWKAMAPAVGVIDGDLVCYGLGCYAAPDAYSQPPGPNTRTTLSITTRSFALNFAADTDPENQLDVFIPVAWASDYVSPALVPRRLDGSFYSSITQHALASGFAQDEGELFDISLMELTMPSCTAIRKLRVKVSGYVSGSCRVTLIVNRHRTAEFVLADANGWIEYAGDDVIVPAGCRVCLQFTNDAFVGIIDNVAYTQLASDDEELCVPCEDDDDGDGDQPPARGGVDCPEYSYTLAELVTAVFGLLGEDEESPVYWTGDEIARYVNDAYVEIARDTKSIEYIEAVALEADDETATLSGNVGPIFRATWDDYKIDNVTKWSLDRTVTNWSQQTGFVSNYVTSLQDVRTITTYKTWDGSVVNAHDLFQEGGFTYSEWADGDPIFEGTRVYLATPTDADPISGYVAILDHTATEARKPGVGEDWETYWIPLSLMVWCVKTPSPLEDDDYPEIRPWSQYGLAFAAAAKALRKYGEQRNEELAAAYADMASDYVGLLRSIVANRTPERIVAIGRGMRSGLRRPLPTDYIIEEP